MQSVKCSITNTRTERALKAKPLIASAFADPKQLEFINLVLDKYVEDGVGELSSSKMKSLINLKYSTIDDAADALGSVQVIRDTFVGFQ